jgi:hypothetical protein
VIKAIELFVVNFADDKRAHLYRSVRFGRRKDKQLANIIIHSPYHTGKENETPRIAYCISVILQLISVFSLSYLLHTVQHFSIMTNGSRVLQGNNAYSNET